MKAKLPPDDVFIREVMENLTDTNTAIAERYGVSRERVRQKREALGLPPVQMVKKGRKAIEAAKREAYGNQQCIICNQPMKRWRIDRGWMTCSTKCSQTWRKLPGPVRIKRRAKHFDQQ